MDTYGDIVEAVEDMSEDRDLSIKQVKQLGIKIRRPIFNSDCEFIREEEYDISGLSIQDDNFVITISETYESAMKGKQNEN